MADTYRGIGIVVAGNVAILSDKSGREFDRIVSTSPQQALDDARFQIDEFFQMEEREAREMGFEDDGEVPYAEDWKYEEFHAEYPW